MQGRRDFPRSSYSALDSILWHPCPAGIPLQLHLQFAIEAGAFRHSECRLLWSRLIDEVCDRTAESMDREVESAARP